MLVLAKQFQLQAGAAAGVLRTDKNMIAYNEGHLNIRQCLFSGAMRFRDDTLWQVDDGKSVVKFNDDDASKIARSYVSNLKLLQAKESKIVKVTHLTVASMEKGSNKADTKIIDCGVVFQRQIDGIPVEGPGGKALVYVNGNEKISGYDHYWRTLGKIHSSIPADKLLTPANAEEALKKYWAKSAFNIEVSEIRFGYFEAGWGEKQSFIQPAYVMPLTLISGDGRIKVGSFHVISAVPDAPAVIMPPAPKEVKQDPRKQ
jgi:hypothetical protein